MPLQVHYVTKMAILKEAGLWQKSDGQLSGVVDGTNRVFTTKEAPIVDSDGNDEVDNYDIRVLVDNVPVELESLDEQYGIVTLLAAPAADAELKAEYHFSSVSDEEVEEIRDDAEDFIASRMDAIDPLPYLDGQVPPTIRKIARVYAAGLLLGRDYGYTKDTDQASKDVTARITQAEKWLEAYVAIGGSTGLSDVSAAEVDVYSEPDVFTTYDSARGEYVGVDRAFMQERYYEDNPYR